MNNHIIKAATGFAFICGLIGTITPSAYADYASGMRLFENGQYASAVYDWDASAEKGDPDSQDALGQAFEAGKGVRKNLVQALKWYTLAANSGQEDAQIHLAQLYLRNEVPNGHPSDAIQWLSQAANQGNGQAAYQLGMFYISGKIVSQDYHQAFQWMSKAAQSGNVAAQNNLGILYENGMGVSQDYKQALNWYLQSAKAGNGNAQDNLGNLYLQGHGVPQSYIWSSFWFAMAQNQGIQQAATQIQASLKHLPTLTITSTTANIRAGAGTQYNRVISSKKDTTFPVLGTMNGWAQIYIPSGTPQHLGWIDTRLTSLKK